MTGPDGPNTSASVAAALRTHAPFLARDAALAGAPWKQMAYLLRWTAREHHVADRVGFWWGDPTEPAHIWSALDAEAYWGIRRLRSALEPEDRFDAVVFYMDRSRGAEPVLLAARTFAGDAAAPFTVSTSRLLDLHAPMRAHLDALTEAQPEPEAPRGVLRRLLGGTVGR